jgi:hypothetical protein
MFFCYLEPAPQFSSLSQNNAPLCSFKPLFCSLRLQFPKQFDLSLIRVLLTQENFILTLSIEGHSWLCTPVWNSDTTGIQNRYSLFVLVWNT